MSTQRDELAEAMQKELDPDWRQYHPGHFEEAADALLAAGWSRPRAVETVEELEALPVGSVIKLPDGEIGMIMAARDKRHVVGYPGHLPTDELAEVIRGTYGDPIRVLFTPGGE
ncbi:glyoxylase-like metal-dependent hydrolase (beta-lactamase superfamily II) [Rhodococcus sp. 27YEA15]|uniref:hypothetical protein n=1 Tax=Rhodococcus sp. 27YEA15 TaxID=3156259 RepID=UPI003C7B6EA4